MRITYTEKDGYLYPDIEIPKEAEVSLGVWAMRRKNYLKEHKKVLYYNLLTSCALNSHLMEIEESAQQMMEELTQTMMKRENLTEKMKSEDPMKWTGMMNNIKQSAKEIVMQELIYN
ncbi:TnpV protein [Anaerofustis stercorihominis]|nr:TnpV protein [Anaerofustis stercorihominis]MCQ4794145.1 TnpV protein [Anaerofustis stercorihominis]